MKTVFRQPDEKLKKTLENLYVNFCSSNLKMPFIPHINTALAVCNSLKSDLDENDYNHIRLTALFHNLVIIYERFDFPEEVINLITNYNIDVNDLKVISFNDLRDRFGGNDWLYLAPQYVINVINYNSECCLIHCLICWATHTVYVIKNLNREFLDNLFIMYNEFEKQLILEGNKYHYQAVMQKLLDEFKMQLEIAKIVLDNESIIMG